MTTGSSGQQQQQVTTNLPSPEQQQIIGAGLPGVLNYAATTPQRYPGSTVAPFDPSQTAGQNMALNAAGSQQKIAQAGADTTTNWLGPNALDVSRDPVVQGAISSATRPIWENLQQMGLPQVRASAESAGQFGGSRQGIEEGRAIYGAELASSDAASKIASDAYATKVKAQLQALGLLPQTEGSLTTPALTTSGVGDVRQGMAQTLLGQDVSNFNWDQLAPYLQAKDVLSTAGGIPGGTAIGTANNPQPNPLTASLGGAASGASLGATIGGPPGALAGGGIGALLPFLHA